MTTSTIAHHAPLKNGTLPRPSDNWTSTEWLHPNKIKMVTDFITTLNFQALCHHATSIRQRAPADCTIDAEKFQCGTDHIVFELVFGDGVCWIARIKLPEGSGFNISVVEMKSEIATINFVKSHSTIPVPEVYGYNLHDAGPLNRVGRPYILFQALPGRMIHTLPLIKDDVKTHVYRQVTSIILQLSRLPPWPQIGFIIPPSESESVNAPLSIKNLALAIRALPLQDSVSSAQAFFDIRAKCFLDRQLSDGNHDKITIAWLYREAIPYILSTESPTFIPGFPLCHADFGSSNILFDDDFNITGIIDWTWAQSGPWQNFACFPFEFSAHVSNGALPLGSRQLFLRVFEEEEARWEANVPLTKYMGSRGGRIAELTSDYQHITERAWLPMENVYELIGLMYGDGTEWEDVKRMAKRELDIGDRLA